MQKVISVIPVVWVVLVVVLFPTFSRIRLRAVLFAFLAGMMFLPVVGASVVNGGANVPVISVSSLHFTKINSICYAVMAAVLFYDLQRVLAFRPRLVDLPMAVWCLCPMLSSLNNDPPPDGTSPFYDGLAQSLDSVILWGIPYFLGRIYLTNRDAWRDFALGMGLAGAVYSPLCLLEVRISPQLHYMLYGFHQHQFAQSVHEDSSYRPMVFFDHGIPLAMWMVTCLLLAGWLWWTDDPDEMGPQRPPIASQLVWLLLLLLPACALLHSSLAQGLCLVGGCVLLTTYYVPTRLGLLALAAIPIAYLALRTTGVTKGEDVVTFVEKYYSAQRAHSLSFRLINEELLKERAFEQPYFGWGGWNRNRIYDVWGNDLTITDGRWIIALGNRGFFGLIAFFASMMAPALRFVFLFSPRSWSSPQVGPATAGAVCVLMFCIDSLLNGGMGLIFPFIAGGLAAINPKALGVQAPQERKAYQLRASRQPVSV